MMHPTTEFLTDFIDSPAAREFGQVRNHLINCKKCRFEANRLAQFKANLIDEIPYFRNDKLDLDLELQQPYRNTDIEAYVDGTLSDAEHDKIGQLVLNNKSALKSALHYATHDAAMTATLASQPDLVSKPSQVTPTPGSQEKEAVDASDSGQASNRIGIRDSIRQLFEWRPSGWLSIPVTAVAVFALSVLLLPQLQYSNNQHLTLTSYQDSQLTHFKQAKTPSPGMGFFGNTSQSREAYDNISIRYTQDSLRINWPAIQDAQGYTFSLFENKNNQKILLTTKSTKERNVIIGKIKLQPAQLYSWELKGETTDQAVFSVSGGFVTGEN